MGVFIVYKSQSPFLYFFYFFGIRFSTKVPNKWAIVKVGHNKGVVDCKFYINKVISTLEDDSTTLINWFSINKMKANPEKFQAIAIGKQTKQQNLSFTRNYRLKRF
jgi:hypothetical protein